MALDATVRESNVWDSIRKFFVDNLARGGSAIPVMFDAGISSPKISGNKVVEKWLNVEQGRIESETVSSYEFRVVCCSRNDMEGFKLTQLRDTLMQYLKPNGEEGIMDLYNSQTWTKVAGMIIIVGQESERLNASNEVKFKVIPLTLKWGAKT